MIDVQQELGAILKAFQSSADEKSRSYLVPAYPEWMHPKDGDVDSRGWVYRVHGGEGAWYSPPLEAAKPKRIS